MTGAPQILVLIKQRRRKSLKKEEGVVWIDGSKSSDSAAGRSKGPLNGNATYSYLRHFHSSIATHQYCYTPLNGNLI